jgi:hypothetical protein
VHKYRDVVTKSRISLNLAVLVSHGLARVPQKELYVQLTKHVPMEPSNMVLFQRTVMQRSVTSTTNKNFYVGEPCPADSFEPPET